VTGVRARKGGETGLNGERYKGGQYLPSSADTEKGRRSVRRPGAGPAEVLIAPGLRAVAPEGFRAIFSKIMVFTTGGDHLKRNNMSNETVAHFGLDAETLEDLIGFYNKGYRYYKPEDYNE